MIMINDINKNEEPDMKKYYDLRKQVRNLYANDIKINPNINDLCSQILQIRDKHKCVESINLDTCKFVIEIGLDDSTGEKMKNKIYNEATGILNNYIDENIKKDSSKNGDGFKLYDDVVVGNSIKFIL